MGDDEHGGYPRPLNGSSQALVASFVIAQPCNVEGFQVSSTNVAAQFILVFDEGSVPANGAVPLFFLNVAATNSGGAYFGSRGRNFLTGCCLVNSSTSATLTIGSADCFFDVQYDPIR